MASVSPQQLTRYSLLALAGLSAEAAHAGVVTSTTLGFTPFTITAGQRQAVDFGNSIGSPFLFSAFGNAGYASFVLQSGGGGDSQQFISNGNGDINRLATNYVVNSVVGTGLSFRNAASSGVGNTGNDIAGGSAGDFNGPDGSQQQGFIGVRFQSSALDPGFHYGFFDVVYDATPLSDSGALTVRGFAYETTTDAPITTFAITGGAAAPEPSSLVLAGLGLLSCGGAGIRSLRAQTKANATTATTMLDA